MAGKLAEERADLGTCPVAHVEIEVQAEAMAHRATVSPRWRRLCHVGSYPEAATCARQAPRSCARWESAGPRVPPRRARSRSRPRTRSSSFFSTSPSPRCSLPEGRLLRDDDQPVPEALRHVRIVAPPGSDGSTSTVEGPAGTTAAEDRVSRRGTGTRVARPRSPRGAARRRGRARQGLSRRLPQPGGSLPGPCGLGTTVAVGRLVPGSSVTICMMHQRGAWNPHRESHRDAAR